MDAALDPLVRRVDEDRWLASRFAPAPARRRLVALYALNYEIARTSESVREAALGDIRLAWWRDALAEVKAGGDGRAHPALAAFAEAARQEPVSHATLEALLAARGLDLESEPFATWSDLRAYLDATAGGVMRLAVEVCAPAHSAAAEGFVQHAAQAWGGVGLLRAASHWQARGRSVLPRETSSAGELLDYATASLAKARARAPRLPSATFPALGYVALLPVYLRALRRGGRGPMPLTRQLALIGAAASGRV
jgi:15-cis-phytoene synthase